VGSWELRNNRKRKKLIYISTLPHSLFPIPYSLFPIPYSPFPNSSL
jgi:hypothetical protein